MILLGGIFWMGDLIVTRQQLVIAERYVAWNKGLRYDGKVGIDTGTLHRYFFADADGSPNPWHKPTSGDGKIDKTFDWSHVASGKSRCAWSFRIGCGTCSTPVTRSTIPVLRIRSGAARTRPEGAEACRA